VRTWALSEGCLSCLALSTPSATNRIRSCVVMAGAGFLGGDGEGWCRNGGRGGSDGGPEGGPADDPGGVEGGFPPRPAVGSSAGGLGDTRRLSSSRRCRISGVMGRGGVGGPSAGITGRRRLLVGGAGVSRRGLRRAGGGMGAVAMLVLGCLMGLRQSCGGSGHGSLVVGDPGRGIRVAIRRISSLACRNSSSILLTFLWWSAAHNSTLPWKVTRCWLQAVLASARKAKASFTRVSCVAWHICRWLSSWVGSRMACQTFCARV